LKPADRFATWGARLRAAAMRVTGNDRGLIDEIRRRRLTYLSPARLEAIASVCRRARSERLPGEFIEAGCALGGSAILIASVKEALRPLRVYDVFGMIPPPGQQDGPDVAARYEVIAGGRSEGIGGDPYYGYEAELVSKVQGNFESFGIDLRDNSVSLIKGLLQDTLNPTGPIAFAHIDVDWYDPVKACLERIVPRLVVGGVVILDDYADWSGCRKASDEFFAKTPVKVAFDDTTGARRVTRLA